MTQIQDLTWGHVARCQDAIRTLGLGLREDATPQTIAAAQRACAPAQEAIAQLQVALSDTEAISATSGQKGGRS